MLRADPILLQMQFQTMQCHFLKLLRITADHGISGSEVPADQHQTVNIMQIHYFG